MNKKQIIGLIVAVAVFVATGAMSVLTKSFSEKERILEKGPVVLLPNFPHSSLFHKCEIM